LPSAQPATQQPPSPSAQRHPRAAKQRARQQIATTSSFPDADDADYQPAAKRSKGAGSIRKQTEVQARALNDFVAWPQNLFDQAAEWEWQPMTNASATRNGWKKVARIEQSSLCAFMKADKAVQQCPGNSGGVTLTQAMVELIRAQVCHE